jgi:hypothetical protein
LAKNLTYPGSTQQQGQVIGYAEENVSDKTGILLIGVPCQVCEHCSALAFKAEKGQAVRFHP